MILLIEKEGIGLNCSEEDSGKTLRKHHVRRNWEVWRNWASPPPNSIFYFYSQQNVQDLLLQSPGKGNIFPFTESAHGILQSEGYRRHNWHSQASVTAAWPMIAKGLHHSPAFQQLQPRGSLGALASGGTAFPGAAPQGQSGRIRWGPGIWLQLKNPQLRAGEVFWTGLFEVNLTLVALTLALNSCCTSTTEHLSPIFPSFPPDLCIILCLSKLPYLQLQRFWQS